ncbi:MAG: PKD domain-containing protein [Desulfuromonadaceae bacterium]
MKLRTTRSSSLNFILASLLMILLSAPAVCLALPDGDADGNGRVTGADALLILRAYIGLDPVTPQIAAHGIITRIGPDNRPHPGSSLSLIDPLLVLQKAIGLINWDFSDPGQVNLAPTANAGSNQTITLNSGETSRSVTLTGSGSDPDGTIASYLWSGSPQPAAVAAPGVTLAAGTYTFTLVVTDNQGAQSVASPVTVTVNAPVPPANQPPTANAGINQTITLNSGETSRSVTLTGSGSDPDGTIASYLWSGSPQPAAVAAPGVTLAAGTHTFTLVVTDNLGAQSVASSVTVTVNAAVPANQLPIANAGANQTITLAVGQLSGSVTLDGSGSTDGDGTIASYSWRAPSGVATPAAGQMPTVTDLTAGSYTFYLTVTDNKGGVSAESLPVTVTINTISNAAPLLNAIGAKSTSEGQLLSFTISGTDTDTFDVANLVYRASGLPAGANFNPANRFFSWIPDFNQSGVYGVTFTLSDGKSSAIETVRITVANTNRPPVLAFIGSKTVSENSALSFSVSASDPDTATDNDTLTYTANGLPAGATFTGQAFAWTPGYDAAPGPYPVTFTATDSHAASAGETVTISVTNSNRPPTLAVQQSASGAEGSSLTFTITGAFDPDGDTLTYSATNLPSGATVNPATGQLTWSAPSFTSSGTYTATIRVTDTGGQFAEQPVTITIADVNQIPVIRTTSLPAAKIDTPYTGKIDAFDPDTDGSITGYVLQAGSPPGMTINASGSMAWLPGAADIEKTYTFTVKASDNKGGTVDSVPYTIKLTDTIPPTVTINAPKELNPGAPYTVTVSTLDNIGVDKLTVSINGTITACPDPAVLCTVTGSVDAAAVPNSKITVAATATDRAGNFSSGSAVIAVATALDTTAPDSVTLSAPSEASPGSSITLSAAATDAGSGVDRFEFHLAGSTTAFATAYPGKPAVSYTIPGDAAAGATIGFAVTVFDAAGNSAGATAATVVKVNDAVDMAPTVSLAVQKAEVYPGNLLPVTVKVTDDRQVVSVDINLAYRKVAGFVTAIDPERSIELPVPPDAIPGSILHIEVRAVDSSGKVTSATGQAAVVAPPTLVGVLTGAVYDDSTGLPLEGASAVLTRIGKADQSSLTDNRGRYSFEADQGAVSVVLSKAGYNRVERPQVAVVANTGTRVADARLTPVPVAGTPLSSAVGGKVSANFGLKEGGVASALAAAGVTAPVDGSIEVTIPAGAITRDAEVVITQIGAQGLQSRRLPPGWSPVAAFSLALTAPDLNLAEEAGISLPNSFNLPAGTRLPLVQWDEPSASWRATGFATVSADGKTVVGTLPSVGNYALAVPDPGVALPAAAGAVLPPATPSLPGDLTATVSPEPQITFYKPGIKSDVGFTLTSGQQLPSGTVLWAVISEVYDFFSGERIVVEPYHQEIVMFGYGLGGNKKLAADFQVSPGQPFNGLQLSKGVITVKAVVPPENARLFSVVGPQGGDVSSLSGETINFPAGAVSQFVPVSLMKFNPADNGLSLPTGFTLVGGVSLTAAGTPIARPLILSVPKPVDFNMAAGGLLVVMPVESAGSTRFAVVGSAAVDENDTNRIVSILTVPGSLSARFPGILKDGRILVLQSTSKLAYTGGTVTAPAAQPFKGAQVTSDSTPLTVYSTPSGFYVAPVKPGQFTLTALDLVTTNSGVTSGTVLEGTFAPADIAMKIEPPKVLAITPLAGATGVPLAEPVKITLSEPVLSSSVSLTNIKVIAADLTEMTGSVELSGDGRSITFRHAEPYAPKTVYTVSVKNLIDRSATSMAAEFTSTFTSLSTDPPVAPPAGSIEATIPGVGGMTTVTGTQGTAGLHDTVVIVNLTTGARNPVLVEPNGGFTVTFGATVKDRLQLEITGQAGATTRVDLPRFRQNNPDGSISEVITGAGSVMGPGGIELELPANVLPDGTKVTLKSVSEADFPVALTDDARKNFSYSGGFELNLGGATPTRYLDIGIPPVGPVTADDQWVLVRAIDVDGAKQMEIVDTARIIDGKIRTSSPPCPGVTGAGVYGLLKSSRPVGVNSVQMAANAYGRNIVSVQPVWVSPNVPLILPFMSLADLNPQRICLPVLSGRVSVVPNSQKIVIPVDDILTLDREIVIRNTSSCIPGRPNSCPEIHFPRNSLEYAYTVAGKLTDGFTVVAKDIANTAYPLNRFKVSAGEVGRVTVRVLVDSVSIALREFEITNLKSAVVDTFPIKTSALELPMEGAAADTFIVTVYDANGATRNPAFTVAPSPYGPGNLLFKALDSTIDPTADMILAYNTTVPPPANPLDINSAVTELKLLDFETGAEIIIPLAEVKAGGVRFAFQGDNSHKFVLDVKYKDGKHDYQTMPGFRITVTNRQTGKVLTSVTAQSPLKDEPVNLPPISDDHQPPQLIAGPPRLDEVDPRGVLSFTFSEPMDPASLKSGFVVKDSKGNKVQGTVLVSNGNRAITFVPTAPFKMGEEYTLTIVGDDSLGTMLGGGAPPMKDVSGNFISTMRFLMKTFAPQVRGSLVIGNDGRPLEPLRDVDFLKKKVAGKVQTTVFALADGKDGYRLLTIDATDPEKPEEIGHSIGGYYKRKLKLMTGITGLKLTGGNPANHPLPDFNGDLAIATSMNTMTGYLSFFDITDHRNPLHISTKTLTANPEQLSAYSENGTIKALGFPRGIDVIKHDTGYAAYTAVGEVGIMVADIGKNIPEVPPFLRTKEMLHAGDFRDLTVLRDRVLGVELYPAGGGQLAVFDPNLALLSSMDLTDKPRKILAVEALSYDRNRDGTIEPTEVYDLAIIAGEKQVVVVDITNLDDMKIVSEIQMLGITREIDFDRDTFKLFAVGDMTTSAGAGTGISIVSLDDPFRAYSIDLDLDGVDDRIVWKYTYTLPNEVIGLKFDKDRGLLYAATQKATFPPQGALDIWSMYSSCSDLIAGYEKKNETQTLGDRSSLLLMEKEALQKGIAKGLDGAFAACGGASVAGITIIEQGSGACLWKSANPVADCTDNYQPGKSDHDFELFTPVTVTPAEQKCIAKTLDEQFRDPTTKEPVEFKLASGRTISFADITFFPMSRENFESGELDANPPTSVAGDVTGDMGLGRQLLLLKWVLEGEYVKGVPGFNLEGKKLGDILNAMKTKKISRVEGHEWANLQEYNLTKSNAFIRVQGASKTASSFNSGYIKQLHDAGKTGIRSAAARLAADTAANKMLLQIDRKDASTITYGGMVYEVNGCLEIDPAVADVSLWTTKPCTSFEEYALAVAARTLRAATPLTIFTRSTIVDEIARFYWTKADRTDRFRIADEVEADAFVAMTDRFIKKVKTDTQTTYASDIGNAPYSAQRSSNLTTAQTRTTEALTKGKLHVVPHIFNKGFRIADDIVVSLFADDGSGTQTLNRELRQTLSGGEHLHPDYEMDAGKYKLDPDGNRIPVFQVKNIDQNAGAGTPRGINVLVDIPERKVNEPVRENNYDGLYYYILNRSAAAPAPVLPATKPDFPLPDKTKLLAPDAVCKSSKRLTITQIILSGGQPLSGDLNLFTGESVTIRLVVQNFSTTDIADVSACSGLTRTCYSVGTVGANATKIHDVVFVIPSESVVGDATPSVYSYESGIQTGATQSFNVSCEPYVVAPPPDDPNPPLTLDDTDDKLTLMREGKSFRYYTVVNRRTGAPKVGANVKMEIEGTMSGPGGYGYTTRTYNLTTNSRGMIVSPRDNTFGLPLDGTHPNEQGLAIPFEAGMTPGTMIFGKIASIDGVSSTCVEPVKFKAALKDREFSQSYSRGLAIKGTVGLIATVEGSGEAGMEISKSRTLLGGSTIQDGDISYSSTLQVGGKASVEFSLYEFEGKAGIAEVEAKVGVETGRSKVTAWGKEYTFKSPMTPADKCAFAMATLPKLGVNPLLIALKNAARTSPAICGNLDTYLTGTSTEFSMEATNTINANIGITSPLGRTEKELGVEFGITASGSSSVKATYGYGYEKSPAGVPVKKSIKEGYSLSGGFDLSAGLTTALDSPSPDKEEKDMLTTELLGNSLKLSASATTVESYGVSFVTDLSAPTKPSSISISYTPPKGFGWKADAAGYTTPITGGKTRKWNFTLTGDSIEPAIRALSNLSAIRDSSAAAGLGRQSLQLVPTVLNEELRKFRNLLMTTDAEYSVEESYGDALDLPFSFKVGALGLKFGGGATVKSESKVSYTLEKGVIVKGHPYPMQKYPRGSLPGPDMGLINSIQDSWKMLADNNAANVSDVIANVPASGLTTLKSLFTATMTIDGSKEPAPFEAGIYSYRFMPIAGPVNEARYAPGDTYGPADAPHYGIGGYHQFLPDGYTLAAQTPLVIDYKDADIVGLDESSLAIYGWDNDKSDWNYVGGVLDMAANTVTTTVNSFKLYTLAPAMPAGKVTFTVQNLGLTGAAGSLTQKFRVTLSGIGMNNGTAAPDGTALVVKTLSQASTKTIPYGKILLPDSSRVDSTSVTLVNGQAVIDVEYPATEQLYYPGRIVVFSARGTAFDEKLLERIQ